MRKKEMANPVVFGIFSMALRYAPQNGARNKKDNERFARKTVDRLGNLQEDIRNKVAEWVDGMTEVVKDGVDRSNRLGPEGYEQVLQGFDNAKKCVEDGKSRFEQLIKNR
jgi:hypothetical protein